MVGVKLSDRYEILRELGRGGMGVVYLAFDPILHREVAIKLIKPSVLTPESEERFRREARVIAKMDHPAIVTVHNIGEHEGALYFVMPLAPGRNLRGYLEERSLSLDEIVDMGIQVGEALDYSHSRGVIHRDIKPENIMISREKHNEGGIRVRVTDFGLARAASENRLTQSGSVVGTISYLSPEQVQGGTIDGQSDVYSFGTVLYECLVGETPFSGEVHSILYRILREAPQPPSMRSGKIGEELERIVMQCLEKDPQRRPRAHEVADHLRRYRAGLEKGQQGKITPFRFRRIRSERMVVPFLVGREKEYNELQRRLNDALLGESQFVVVGGEAGLGKSRLLEELETLARSRKIRVLHGRFLEQDKAFPYQGFCEAIQEHFQSRSTDSPTPVDLSDLAADLASLFPALSEISEIRTTSSSTGPAQLAETKKAEDRTYVFELLARTMARIAAGKPLILLLEDLHVADVSLDALQYIVHRLGPTPTLIVGTYRTTEIDKRHPLLRTLDSFHGDRRFASIVLKPLTASEHYLLLEKLIGSAGLSDSLTARLYEATEGNPYFTKELVRSLFDTDGLVQDQTGLWILSSDAGITSEALPATIQQAVEKRIERLPENLREVLSIASVAGKTFEFRDLEVLVEGRERLDEEVDILLRDGFLEEERQSRGDHFRFCSGMLRDVLYGQLLRRKRKSLHRKFGEHLEKLHAGRMERAYQQLLHHFAQGDVPEKVVEYGLKLSARSLDLLSAEEAIRAAKTVLDFLEEVKDLPAEAETRILLGKGYRMAGNTDAALKELENVIKIYEAAGQNSEAVKAILLAAETAWSGRKVEQTVRWIGKGLATARAAGEMSSLTKLLSLGATAANLRGDYEQAKAYLEERDRLMPPVPERQEEAPRGGSIVVAQPFAIRPMHPVNIKLDEEAEILANVFEQLIRTDADGNLVPHLCERWEAVEGGKSFLLTLRANVRLQDGRPLTASEVKASMEAAVRLGKDALPPAFAPIHGIAEFLKEGLNHIEGILVVSDQKLVIQLRELLPIYPSLLTDMKTSIVREATPDGAFIGTGPFKIASFPSNGVVLERNEDYWKGNTADVDAIEFRGMLSASEIAAGFRSGEFDLVHDLFPQDLEGILRDRRLRAGLVEATKKNVYFVLFNNSSPYGSLPALRQALCGIIRTQELIHRTLGRFAQPAEGLFPPGILGHDPGRRRQPLSHERAVELLQSVGGRPVRLKASVHPILQDRYEPLTSALFQLWKAIGVEISIETPTMESFLQRLRENEGIDLLIGRWIGEYDDPDDFTYSLFHSSMGDRKNYFCSKELDQLIEEARAESRAEMRETLYRRIESALMDNAILMPLFHEIDYRVSQSRIQRLHLRSIAPYVNYSEMGIAQSETAATVARKGGGTIQVPFAGVLNSLDPSLSFLFLQGEVFPNIFETLTQMEEAKIGPDLATYQTEQGGHRYRFHLREDVRFHDGRRLTSRDVRYSFERLLQNNATENRWVLAPIRGAKALLRGQAGDLEGFRIVSPREFTIDLEDPTSFFPAIIAFSFAAIVPEGSDRFAGSWRDGCVGTGPFRVVLFEPDTRLELEPNPYYWRRGVPKCDRLIFVFGVPPAEIASEFRAGRFSLAWEMPPSDVEALRHEFNFALNYREMPRLSTYYVAFNIHRGPLSDEKLRLELVRSVDAEALVRRAAGRLAVPAHQFIPPGLIGYEATRRSVPRSPLKSRPSFNVNLTTTLNSVYQGAYANFARELMAAFAAAGFQIQVVETRSEYYANQAEALATADLALTRWLADYPDADNFVGLLHSQQGLVGRMCGTPEVDALIERGRRETDPSVRHQIYRDLENIITERALLLPLFQEQSYCFAAPEVEGLELNFFTPLVVYEKIWKRQD